MRFPTPDLDALVLSIATDPRGMPVRAMEAVLDRGEAATEPVMEVLRRALRAEAARDVVDGRVVNDEADFEPDPVWLLVLLGELRDPRSVPVLLEVIRGAGPDAHILPMVAAEALAKLGPPALEGVRELLEAGSPEQRLWAYAVAGWIEDDAAYELLVAALESDPELADVIGNALGDQGRMEAVTVLMAALPRVEPWQRTELEDAIRALHQADRAVKRLHEADWRLRYRLHPAIGAMAPSWPVMSAVIREQERARDARQSHAVLSLEEILAQPLENREEPERCDCCGVEPFEATGMPVCPATAVSMAAVQHRFLGEMRDELDTDDLFDVLGVAEDECMALGYLPLEPENAAEQEEIADEMLSWEILIAACRWLLERGIESVSAGRATLLAEVARLAELHGDPEGVLSAFPTNGARNGPAPVGRNDPCPCGSGRKYKKCCGRPGPS